MCGLTKLSNTTRSCSSTTHTRAHTSRDPSLPAPTILHPRARTPPSGGAAAGQEWAAAVGGRRTWRQRGQPREAKAAAHSGLGRAPVRWSRRASRERQCLPHTPQRGSCAECSDVRMCSTRKNHKKREYG
uniref:Uncharacterized protein n=1 Tax=Oryza meridionalis TaxID=40149 RepID=A0A0E0BVU0_9ORYZ